MLNLQDCEGAACTLEDSPIELLTQFAHDHCLGLLTEVRADNLEDEF